MCRWGSRWWYGGDCESLTGMRGAREPPRVIEVFCFLMVMIVTGISTFIEIHKTVHLKWILIMVCKLYLNKFDFKRENAR